MRTEFKKIVFGIVLILCAALPARADWQLADGHKMHFPQMPNPYGWDIDLRQYELADDWLCTRTGEVNDIHFWISWAEDYVGTLQNIQVKIYSNDANGSFSKPATTLWSRTFSPGEFIINPDPGYGDQGYWIPNPTSPTIHWHDHQLYFQVNIKDINYPFTQEEGQIYWLALKVPISQYPYPGWKTSLDHFMDAATVKYGTSWQPLYEPNEPGVPIDFAFVITGGQEPNEEPEPNISGKWVQKPDLSSNGLDVMASVPLILADDFECNKSTLITDITIWGSWLKDILPPGGPNNVWFTLSIHSDIPADPNMGHYYSMPGEILWLRNLLPSEVSIERQDINEGWYDPLAPIYDPNGDHVCWKYVFHIPEADAFCQQGEPNKPLVYWLNVQAYFDFNDSNNLVPFGWKTSVDHWNDDAVWGVTELNEPNGTWQELRYPYEHPLAGQSIDLAFVIDGNIPCEPNIEPNLPPKWLQRPDLSPNGVDVKATEPLILADDFECNKSTLITDITIWGSWKDDILPLGGETNVSFSLSIHADIPDPDPCDPCNWSMPGRVLWHGIFQPSEVSVEQPDINEGWFDPSTDEYIFPGDHVCWKYVFHIPPQEAFCQQGDPNRPVVYWLDVQAYPYPTTLAEFGWKSSTNHWNDDAVWAMGAEPYLGIWQELRYPLGHPLYPQSIDLAFAIDGNIPCSPPPENELGDAPDSSNNFGVAMTAYPPSVLNANYPTVYLTGSPPFGPIHWMPLVVAWLGPSVTLENEADIGPDQDPTNNIIPLTNTPDQDVNDDGVLNMPLVLRYCYPTTFDYQINVVNPNIDLYANVWFDWNRDGDWDDTPIGCGNEWAVQDQYFPAGSLPAGLNTVTSSTFLPWHPSFKEAKIWMRITLSEQPWAGSGSGGSGPATGYYYGETEDYFFTPDPNCLFAGRVFSVPCNPTVNLTITAAMVSRWHYLGEPNCWCCDAQKCGNGAYAGPSRNRVDAVDLAALQTSFAKFYTQPGYNPCVDFNLSGRVDAVDLAILKVHFGKIVGSSCCL